MCSNSTCCGSRALHRDESLVGRYYDPGTGQFISVDPLVNETGQPYAYTGDDPVNGTDPLGLCTTKAYGYLYAGPCATTGAEAIAAENGIQAASQRTGILGDIESGIKRYDPAYQALEDYQNEFHAAQDGCSLSTVFGFAAKAVVADVETGASVDGEGEVIDAVDGAGTNIVRGGTLSNILNQTVDDQGLLTELSVNAGEGVSIPELASYPPVPGYGKISVTTLDKLIEAGGKLEPAAIEGNPFHSLISGIAPQDLIDIMTQDSNPSRG
jgi:hypothetical protein